MQLNPARLSNIHILIADSDLYLSSIVCHMIHTMGLTRITRACNGREARQIIDTQPIDILMTEWSMHGPDGLELIRYLRDPARSPNLTIPIIMTTGRAERRNVKQARDLGITEFLVKPVNTAMLFERIRQVFDKPRNFVISPSFVGPDRRIRFGSEDAADKRTAKPMIVSKPSIALASGHSNILVSATHDLHNKAHINNSISDVITPDLLSRADEVIHSYKDESEQWIFGDVKRLEKAITAMADGMPNAKEKAQDATLSIKSRAGMFGFDMATNVAFALYIFLDHDFKGGLADHLLILRKHVDVIKVLLASQKIGNSKTIEEELAEELLKMTAKLKT